MTKWLFGEATFEDIHSSISYLDRNITDQRTMPETQCQFAKTHLTLSISVQQLEAPQPHAGLHVHVDVHAVTWPEPQQLPHPAHSAAEAAGHPSIAASTHRKSGPHLTLCVTLQAHTHVVRSLPHLLPHLWHGGEHENNQPRSHFPAFVCLF